jgi:hypothetical protein
MADVMNGGTGEAAQEQLPAVRSPEEIRRMKSAQAALVGVWESMLESAEKSKSAKRFRQGAKMGMQFYIGPHTDVFKSAGGDDLSSWNWDEDSPKVTVNKSFELVKVFGPFLYQSNPRRRVVCRSENNPVYYALSQVIEDYLNYTPRELNLKREQREVIDEAIIKGRGVAWTGLDDDTGLVGTFFESVDNIRIDPDCKRPRDAFWVARKMEEPHWVLKERYPGSGAKNAKPNTHFETKDPETNESPERTSSNDVVRYWEIYSKMGVGIRSRRGMKENRGEFEGFDDKNDFKLVVISSENKTPIHVGDWPAPMFLDNEWMHTFLDFNTVPNEPWPVSILSAAEGEQRAIDWLASFILAKAHAHAREVIAVDSEGGQDLMEKIQSGLDMIIAEVKTGVHGKKISDMVQSISLPGGEVMKTLLDTLSLFQNLFEARTGLSEVLMAMSQRSMRSATEAELRQQNANIRPDDMANVVADFNTVIARKEAMMMRFLLEPEDIENAIGSDKVYAYALDVLLGGTPLTLPELRELGQRMGVPGIASYFNSPEEIAQFVAAAAEETGMGITEALEMAGFGVQIGKVGAARVWRDTADMTAEQVAREFTYEIETGSIQKLTPQAKADQAMTMMQTVGPAALQNGDYNAYNQIWKQYYDAVGTPQEERVFIQPPPMPLPPPEGESKKKESK